MSSSTGGILVIRGGAIGDFILTLPAIAALRRQFPGTRIEVLGYPHIIELAVAGGLADRAEPIEARAMAGFFARHGELSERLAYYFSEFDLIISYLYDPDEIFQTNVLRCAGVQFIAGPHRPDENAGVHATSVYLKPLERLAIFDADPVPRLSVQSPERSQGLAMHPGSGSERKNWPESRWAELLERLRGVVGDILLVGGEAEGERLDRLARGLPPSSGSVARSLPLTTLAGMLQRRAFFVGHDSGISHLAASLGLAGLVLWGETNEDVWRPRSDRFRVLRHAHGLPGLPVEVVFSQLVESMAEHTNRGSM
jgi:ADP-heptose:LPS heptosyltransferase